jgi:hypothetical protein
VDGFIRDIRIAMQREAPEVTVFCAYKTIRKRNEETKAMEDNILYGVHTNNASKVLGVQYTRVMLCCGSIRFHADFFSDGLGANTDRDALRAYNLLFDQFFRFGPSKMSVRAGAVQSISYSGLKADGVKADDVCMAWLVFIVASLAMFDEDRYLQAGALVPSDTPTLVRNVHVKMRQFAGDIEFV